MKRRIIELRSGAWEWAVVDPDDPRALARPRNRIRATTVASGLAAPQDIHTEDAARAGAPPLPKRRIELRSVDDPRDRMCVRVPPHLGQAGDEAAVTMLALNPDRRVVIGSDGTKWYLWPVHHESEAPPSLGASRSVRALPEGGRPRTVSLPEGLALGQLTDREILDLLD